MDAREERSERRLEAGDWVVATGAASGTARGLGKLTGGEYDPQDGALVKARVELTVGPRWIDPGQLLRIEPEDEVALATHALDLGLVPEPRAQLVRERLERARTDRAFVRTPGLLDAVWSALDDPLGAPGLVEWFESGGAAPRRPESPALQPVPFPRPSSAEPPATRPIDEPALVRAIVRSFAGATVLRIAAELRVERLAFPGLQEAIEATVSLRRLIDCLTPDELQAVPRDLVWLCVPGPVESTCAAAPFQATGSTEGLAPELVRAVLYAFDGSTVCRIAASLGVGRGSFSCPQQALAETVALSSVLGALTATELEKACSATGRRDQLVQELARARALERCRAEPLERLDTASVTPSVAHAAAAKRRSTTLGRAVALLESCSLMVLVEHFAERWGGTEYDRRAALLAADPPLEELLEPPSWAELARLAHRCGVAPADRVAMISGLIGGSATHAQRSEPPVSWSGEVLSRVLGSLDDALLVGIASAAGVVLPPEGASSTWVLIAILAARPPLESLLGLMQREQLRWACTRCGLTPAPDASEEALRVELIELAKRTG